MKKRYCFICRNQIDERKVNQVFDRFKLTGWEWSWHDGYRRISLDICPACMHMIRAQRYQQNIRVGSRRNEKQ